MPISPVSYFRPWLYIDDWRHINRSRILIMFYNPVHLTQRWLMIYITVVSLIPSAPSSYSRTSLILRNTCHRSDDIRFVWELGSWPDWLNETVELIQRGESSIGA